MGRCWPSEIRFEYLLDLIFAETLAAVLLFSKDFDLGESVLPRNDARRPVDFVRVGPDDRLGTSVLKFGVFVFLSSLGQSRSTALRGGSMRLARLLPGSAPVLLRYERVLVAIPLTW